MTRKAFQLGAKRLLDLTLTIPAAGFLLPLLVVVGILVFTRLGSPVFFRQMRPGLHGKPFQLIKFRTMTNECDENGILLCEADRLTSLGRFLRRTSLDEIPELFNVLKGDMSLVGPRPLLMQYLGRYSPTQARRHEVKPGLTGWAQVNGRNAVSWAKKFTYDVWYVDNFNLWLDIRILAMTLIKVVGMDNIDSDQGAHTEEFLGAKDLT